MFPGESGQRLALLERFQQQHGTGILTLLFTDLVDSTRLKQDLGDTRAVGLVQQHHARVREWLKEFRDAQEIETAGDSILLVFARPSDAVRFALGLQVRNRQLSAEARANIQDRVGIHAGEVFVHDQAGDAKLFGSQVDLCGRVLNMASGGQVLLTRFVFDNARAVLKGNDLQGVGQLAWASHGPYLLKGIEEAVEVCEVAEAGQSPPAAPKTSDKAQRQVRPDEEPVLGWRPAVGQAVPGIEWVLEEKLGEGGFGEVWVAQHPKLKQRRVFKFCFRVDRVRALKRELTLFRLLKENVGEHPNIVRLHEVYLEQPPFYLEEEFVEGKDLKTWCEAQGGIDKVPLEVRLEIVAQAAEALQAAHDAGIIHRDVKPGNILVSGDASGTKPPVVKLTDFGIGQVISAEYLKGVTQAGFTQTMAGSTSSGTGTTMYLAPEIIAGNPATTRSDIYSLGVVLYQMLVGDFTKPVTTDWAQDVADALLREDLRHCFAGNPSDRFAAAAQLAISLRNWNRRRQAFLAEERLRQQVALRHRIALASVSATGLMLLVAIALGYGLHQARIARASEARLRRLAEQQAYASDMKAAQVAIQQNNMGMAWSLLRQYEPKPGGEDLRGLEWRYLWQECRPDEHRSFPHPAMVYGAALSPDGQYLATGCYDHKIHIWETKAARQILEFGAQGWTAAETQGPRRVAAFSPEGTWLAAAGRDGVEVRETTRWRVIRELQSSKAPLAFSADGKILVTGGTHGLVFWSTADWSHSVLTNAFAMGNCFALSTDGARVACYYRPNDEVNTIAQANIEVWDVPSRTRRVIEGTSETCSLALSPDGQWLAHGNGRGEVGLLNLVTGESGVTLRQHQGNVIGIAFSPDGRRLATAASDQLIHLWETGTTNMLSSRQGHLREIWSLSFSADGRQLLSASMDRTARLWPAIQTSPRHHVFTIPTNAWIVSSLSNASAVVTADYHARTFQIWRLPDGTLIRTTPFSELDPAGQGFRDVLAAPDGRWLLGATTNGAIYYFDPSNGALQKSVQVPTTNFTTWAGSRDERWLVLWLSDGTGGMLCDLLMPRAARHIPDYVPANSFIGFSPDNRLVAYATTNHTVKLWDLAAQRERATLRGHRWWIFSLGFSPDGRLLASGDGAGDVWLWSVDEAKPLFETPLQGHLSTANLVAFSSDNRTLATFGQERIMRWWSVATGREMLQFPSEPKWAPGYLDLPTDGKSGRCLLLFYQEPGRVRVTTVPSFAEIDAAEKAQTAGKTK